MVNQNMLLTHKEKSENWSKKGFIYLFTYLYIYTYFLGGGGIKTNYVTTPDFASGLSKSIIGSDYHCLC